VALSLQHNGITLTVSNLQGIELTLQVAQSQIDAKRVADWLREHQNCWLIDQFDLHSQAFCTTLRKIISNIPISLKGRCHATVPNPN
jgi:hypothetical protein